MSELRLVVLGIPCRSPYRIVFTLNELGMLKLFSWAGEVFNLSISKDVGRACFCPRPVFKASRSSAYHLWTAHGLPGDSLPGVVGSVPATGHWLQRVYHMHMQYVCTCICSTRPTLCAAWVSDPFTWQPLWLPHCCSVLKPGELLPS